MPLSLKNSIILIISFFAFLISINARAPLTLEYASVSSLSIQGDGDNFHGAISHDGRYVAFYSRSTNLSPSDTDSNLDLFLRDRLSGTTTHIAPIRTSSTVFAENPIEISGDSNWVVFASEASLVTEDTNGLKDIYLYNIPTGSIQLVSDGISTQEFNNPTVSYSACYIAYDRGLQGVYLYNRTTDTTSLIANGSLDPRISADGNYIVYGRFSDRAVFLYDSVLGSATQIDTTSYTFSISADGTHIVYSKDGFPGGRAIRIYNRVTNTYVTISGNGDSQDNSITADGSWVVFGSFANDLVAGPDTVSQDIFAYEVATGTIERLSLLTSGDEPNNRTDLPIISSNGQHVLFQTSSTDYIVPDTNASFSDVLVADYGLISTAINMPTDDNCNPNPDYHSNIVPNSTISITETNSIVLNISNIGDAGSILDVTMLNPLSNFSISSLPNNLTPTDGVFGVTISCNVSHASETLILATNETATPNYSYILECLDNSTTMVNVNSSDLVNNVNDEPQFEIFDPAISKIGFLLRDPVGVTNEQLEWIITVNNTGRVEGQNIIITDTLVDSLQIDRVEASGANVNIDNQTVSVVYPALAVNQSVQFSIFTTVLDGLDILNTACVSASNQIQSECTTGQIVAYLPQTGEIPVWKRWLWIISLLIVAVSGLYITKRTVSRNLC